MPGLLAGRTAIILAVDGEIAVTLSSALSVAGADVSVACPSFADRASVEAALVSAPDVVVFAHIPPAVLEPGSLVEMSEDDWQRRAEAPIRAALWTAQAAYPHLQGRDGRLIFVCPTLCMEGAAGLVAYSAAVEAQRMLAKSAARRWARDGITVNVVAPPAGALAPDLATSAPDAVRAIPSIDGGHALGGMASAVVWLASREAAAITGATIAADSGALMSP